MMKTPYKAIAYIPAWYRPRDWENEPFDYVFRSTLPQCLARIDDGNSWRGEECLEFAAFADRDFDGKLIPLCAEHKNWVREQKAETYSLKTPKIIFEHRRHIGIVRSYISKAR